MERQFLAYRRSGDPRPLARVFDKAAPELWRVAVHLCRDRHAAEDAVQATFLTAIEKRADWDSSRPLLPWLLGLCANRVREARRQDARSPDVERVAAACGERDPAVTAELTEFRSAFDHALAGVAEPYRSTLTRHLVHGLSASEIAERDELAAGAVRMRLCRGLEQLRHRLPKGFVAGGVTAMALSSSAMATMRSRVLAAAETTGGVGPSEIAVRYATSSAKVAVGAALLLGIGAVILLLLDRRAIETTLVTRGALAADPSVVIGGQDESASPIGANGIERTTVAAHTGELRVVARNASDQVPLAGVEMIVVCGDAATATADPPSEVVTREGRTDARGVASFVLPAGPARIEIVAPLPRTELVTVIAGAAIECAVWLPVVHEADVEVVDSRGVPVAGASILGRDPSDESASDVAVGTTGQDGRWRAPFRRKLLVRAATAGVAVSPAVELTALAPSATLRLGGVAGTVTGVVRGLDGAPLKGTFVAIEPMRDGVPDACFVLQTDDTGRYAFDHLSSGRHVVFAWRRDGDDVRFQRTEVDALPNTPTVADITFGRLPRIAVSLRHRDGTACADASVRVVAREQPARGIVILSHAQTDEHGRATIEGLPPGVHDVTVATSRGERVLQEAISLRDGEELPFVRTVDGGAWLEVCVSDATHAPLAGMRVRLCRALPINTERDWLWPLAESVVTGEDGVARFDEVGVGDAALWVTVRAAGDRSSLPLATHEVRTNGRTAIVLTPAELAGRAVRGRIDVQGELVGARLRVLLYSAVMPESKIHGSCAVSVGDDMEFEFADVPPGSYDLRVVASGPIAASGVVALRHDIRVTAENDVDLGEVVASRSTVRCRLVRGDGALVEGARCLVRLSPRDPYSEWPQVCTEDGIALSGLPAGASEVLVLSADCAPTVATLTSPSSSVQVIHVVPAATVTLRFDDVPTEFSKGRLTLLRDGRPWFLENEFDAAAVRRLGLPPGNYSVEFVNGVAPWGTEFTIGMDATDVAVRRR